MYFVLTGHITVRYRVTYYTQLCGASVWTFVGRIERASEDPYTEVRQDTEGGNGYVAITREFTTLHNSGDDHCNDPIISQDISASATSSAVETGVDAPVADGGRSLETKEYFVTAWGTSYAAESRRRCYREETIKDAVMINDRMFFTVWCSVRD